MSDVNDLFRKTSLERISSPDKLNEYIKITNPSLISILVAIFVIFGASIYWIFFSSIPKYMNITGVIATSVSEPNSLQKVYCYVPISSANRLKKGMGVEISPEGYPRESNGFIRGEVLNVGTDVVDNEFFVSRFDNPSIVVPLLTNAPKTNLVEVELSMGEGSTEKINGVQFSNGSICSVSAIIGEKKPYELIFNVES